METEPISPQQTVKSPIDAPQPPSYSLQEHLQSPTPEKTSNYILYVSFLLFGATLVWGGYVYSQSSKKESTNEVIHPSSTSNPTQNNNFSEQKIVNQEWKTFSQEDISFQYPSSFVIDSSSNGSNITSFIEGDSEKLRLAIESSNQPSFASRLQPINTHTQMGNQWIVYPQSKYCDTGDCATTPMTYETEIGNKRYSWILVRIDQNSTEFTQILSTFKVSGEQNNSNSQSIYYDSKHNFSLKHPSDWKVEKREGDPNTYIFSPPVNTSYPEPLQYGLSVSVLENTQQKTFEQWLQEMYTDSDLQLSIQPTTVGKYNGYRVEGLPSRSGQINIFLNFKQNQYLHLGFGPYDEVNPFEKQAEYTEIFNSIVNSLSF